MIKVPILLAVVILAATLNTELPKIIKNTFKSNSLPVLNVTIGEKFSLPLPHFDSIFEKKNFKAFEITAEEFNEIEPGTAGKHDDVKQNVKEETEIGMDYLPFECILNEPKVEIKKELRSIREQYSRVKNTRWQQNQYVHLGFKSLLYILNVGSSELIAYLYNDITIDKLTTYKLTELIQKEDQDKDITTSSPVMAANSQEDSLYVFTSLGVWQVKTKTILTNVRKIDSVSGFNSANYGGIDKIIHGQGKVMIGMKRSSRVFIIPQPTQKVQGPSFKELTTYYQEKIFPQDIFLVSNTLYVLDFYKGIYVYTILSHNEVRERGFISFESYGGNYQFEIYQNTMFINFNDIDGSKVVEISFDLETDSHFLVRYFKSDDFICSLQVFNILTDYQGKSVSQRYAEESFDSFLFLIENYDDIEIYPFNIDPRMITRAYNAVKLKGRDVRRIFHLKTDYYIIITNQQLKYVRIGVEKPAVVCRTKRGEKTSTSKYFRLSLSSNISTCEHKDHSLAAKRLFNEYCELQTNYFVHIGDPEESQFQKLVLYGVVIGVVVLFVGGLLCLMQWRNNKMVLLGRLKDEIVRFRNRHRKMQPFTQEIGDQKDIEIEVPEVHVTAEQQN